MACAYVYRFKNNKDEVIYYGKTVSMEKRMAQHFQNGHLSQDCYRSVCKIEYQKYKTESDSLIMEQFFISKYSPRYNKQGQSRDTPTLQLDEGKWKLYKEIRPTKPLQRQDTGFIWKLIAFIYLIGMVLKLMGLY